MASEYRLVNDFILRVFSSQSLSQIRDGLRNTPEQTRQRMYGGGKTDAASLERRWAILDAPETIRQTLADPLTIETAERYQRNIENFVGTVKLPVGVIGPLLVKGLFARGEYYVPLATTEAAMVASYHRGSQIITEAGGCTALTVSEGVSRSPGFAFRDLPAAGEFVAWTLSQMEQFKQAAESTTRHGRLIDMTVHIEGNHVYLNFVMTTGDASGQNMVTIATAAICEYIRQNSPVQPEYYFLEANMSGDKKATFRSFTTVRGKKVSVEVVVPAQVIERRLHTTVKRVVDYYRMSSLGGIMNGGIGVQGHYANGLAALFIATGQDAACVSEASVGMTRMEMTEDGSLYTSVTLPNLIVGTVGGGTGLPSQRACLEMMGLAGEGKSGAFAEVTAAVALAGELSIIGALSAGDFARAHQRLARGRNTAAEAAVDAD